MSDEHDLPIMMIGLSSRERNLLLGALWNDRLFQEKVSEPLIGTEHEAETMMIFQRIFDLVAKLGGDPTQPSFVVA